MQLATKIYLASNEELDHMYPDPTRVREIVKSLTAMERLCGELVGRSRLDENFHELWNVYTAVRDANAKIRLWQNPTH
jgi:hypothetical protein